MMTSLVRTSLLLVVASLGLPLAACAANHPDTPRIARDLTIPPRGNGGVPHAPTIPLAQVKLATQADYDALEADYSGRLDLDTLVDILQTMAKNADPARRPEDVLLLQRLALLDLRQASDRKHLARALAVASRLHEAAPKSPNTLYLLAYINALIMRPSEDHAFRLAGKRRDLALRLGEHWRALLRVAPHYVGPHDIHASAIRARLRALDAAIAAVPAAPPGLGVRDAIPGAGSPIISPGGTIIVPVRAAASPSVTRARDTLYVLAASNLGKQRSTCSDRAHGVPPPPPPDRASTEAERWVDLRCAVLLDNPDDALRALARLIETGALAKPCRWLAKVHGGAATLRARVGAAMTAGHLPGCSPPT